MDGLCGTCRHWTRPDERTGYGNVVSYQDDLWDEDDDGPGTGYVRGDADDRKFGECGLIDLGQDLPMDDPTPLAVTLDASNYVANLYTQAEFGCVLHQPKEDA